MLNTQLNKKIDNLIEVGTICEVSKEKAIARVNIFGRVTDFLPVVSLSNSFKRHFIPIKVKEQCIVISPFGNASSGFIVRSIFNKDCKEPDKSNENTEVIEYIDGTIITYDTKAKELKISASNKITIIAKGDVDISCKNSNIKAKENVNISCKNSNIKAKENVNISCKSSNIKAKENVNINCKSSKIKANSVKVNSPSIDLGEGGIGVVTGECICAFTGNPHHDFSKNTRSKK